MPSRTRHPAPGSSDPSITAGMGASTCKTPPMLPVVTFRHIICSNWPRPRPLMGIDLWMCWTCTGTLKRREAEFGLPARTLPTPLSLHACRLRVLCGIRHIRKPAGSLSGPRWARSGFCHVWRKKSIRIMPVPNWPSRNTITVAAVTSPAELRKPMCWEYSGVRGSLLQTRGPFLRMKHSFREVSGCFATLTA